MGVMATWALVEVALHEMGGLKSGPSVIGVVKGGGREKEVRRPYQA